MYFEELRAELVDSARQRIHSGEFSERRLGHLCGLSQSHMHNVLNGIRALSNASADSLMCALGMEIPDLVWRVSARQQTAVSPIPAISIVPKLRGRIGPGADADLSSLRGFTPLPGTLVAGLVNPVVAVLGPDLTLPGALASLDLVLLDQNPKLRAAPEVGLWVIAEGAGLRVRHLALDGSHLRMGPAACVGEPAHWPPFPMRGRNILDIVRARIVWMVRKMEETPAGPADPAGQGD